jgi:hypothetical protein
MAHILLRVGLQRIVMTGYFYGEVMAPTKSCGRLCFFGVLVLLIKAMIKSKMVALLSLVCIKSCSPRERWIGGMRNHFERVSFRCYLFEDA